MEWTLLPYQGVRGPEDVSESITITISIIITLRNRPWQCPIHNDNDYGVVDGIGQYYHQPPILFASAAVVVVFHCCLDLDEYNHNNLWIQPGGGGSVTPFTQNILAEQSLTSHPHHSPTTARELTKFLPFKAHPCHWVICVLWGLWGRGCGYNTMNRWTMWRWWRCSGGCPLVRSKSTSNNCWIIIT